MKSLPKQLFAIAEAADKCLAEVRSNELQQILQALVAACSQIGKAWSGSHIGYHADVYTTDLSPRLPAAQFSSEWGLKEVWPTSTPHRCWKIQDRDVVINHIEELAGNPDMKAIDNRLAPIRAQFFKLKEDAISILNAEPALLRDSYLQNKLVQTEQVEAADVGATMAAVLPSGQVWSRDSLAVSQGLRVAPHQTVAAVPVAASSLENALAQLARYCREAASHLERLDIKALKSGRIGTNVFIGHGRSPIWRELKDFVGDRLALPVDEFNSIPVAGIANVERLTQLLDAAAFAFLIMTAEDEHSDGQLVARQNVIHEVGLFQGRLGFRRAIVLLEEGCTEFSNIQGLGQIHFPSGRISAVFEQVRAVLEREDLLDL
jgi:Predicted nucleotide-binding protein containing TIR-like domain